MVCAYSLNNNLINNDIISCYNLSGVAVSAFICCIEVLDPYCILAFSLHTLACLSVAIKQCGRLVRF